MFVSGAPLRSPGPRGEQQVDRSFAMFFNSGDNAVQVELPENDWVPLRRGRAVHRPEAPDRHAGQDRRPACGWAARSVVVLREI